MKAVDLLQRSIAGVLGITTVVLGASVAMNIGSAVWWHNNGVGVESMAWEIRTLCFTHFSFVQCVFFLTQLKKQDEDGASR